MPNNDKAPVTPGVAVEQSIISTALSDGFSQEENNTKVIKMTKVKIILLTIPYIINLTPLIQF